MNLYDDALAVQQLYPFTLTKSIADIRIGILTIREKWAAAGLAESTLNVSSNLLPTAHVVKAVKAGGNKPEMPGAMLIMHPWHIFQYNDLAIRNDVEWLTAGKISQPISGTNKISGAENIFLEQGARVEHCVLNATAGPIYFGKNAEAMEGCLIRGPFALCEGAILKMGTKVYGATTIGPYSVAGGEIKNTVISGYSNKGHDGYLGDSVIGEWCNLGAGTSNSNLKNNAGNVGVWNPHVSGYISAGTKCGLFMGDYSRCAINTSFNTGTVTGVCCNIFGNGLTPKHLPSFSWGATGQIKYDLDKAVRDIISWKQLKNQSLNEKEIQQLKYIFEH